jgi:hypothetical protein
VSRASCEDLRAGYEALRAQALGGLPTDSPCGLTVMLTQGLPAWIRAWAAPASVPLPPAPAAARTGAGLGAEVVRLLTEMALGGGRRRAIS